MNQLCRLLFGLFIVVVVVALNNDLEEWNAFKLKYAKNYHNETEDALRMDIFINNKRKIEKHNKKHADGQSTFKMALNKFSDLTSEEMNAHMKGLLQPDFLKSKHITNETADFFVGAWHRHHRHHHHHHHHRHHHHRNAILHLPKSIDWRSEGAVNSVADKVQGKCGSCWAFSTTGAIEGQYFRKTGKLIKLSEQSLVDCTLFCGCFGCSLLEAYQSVRDSGIDTSDQYPSPYTEEDGSCQFNSTNPIKIKGYKQIPAGDEEKLTEAIATIGPISVQISAGHPSFYHYSSGVYYEPECGSRLDHGVLAVGYGTTEDGKDYYILKNWWSEAWGEDGYVKMARNRGNHCGVAAGAMYPTL